MAYYDHIAKSWHQATGHQGGSFKKHVLNAILLQKMAPIAGQAILELGAGNGYFMRLALDHFSMQQPIRIVITDQSNRLLAAAAEFFYIPEAEYLPLDVRAPYPFTDESFDLILATMVFNEVTTGGLRRALRECYRVLRSAGLLLITVTHPQFIKSLDEREQLKRTRKGILTMPGSRKMWLPIVPREVGEYGRLLNKAGFSWEALDVYPSERVLSEKRGLRQIGKRPVGLVFECRKVESEFRLR